MRVGLAKEFAERLRQLRTQSEFTQERLAEKSGLSVDSIRRLERGAFSPTLSTLQKIAQGLSTTVAEMLGSEDEATEAEDLRRLYDYLATLRPEQHRLALRVLRAMFDEEVKRSRRR